MAVPASDTIVVVEDGMMTSMPHRETLRRCQTPQGFRLSVIRQAHELALADPGFADLTATDDCGVVLRYLPDVPVAVVPGSERNIKITYPQDLSVAEVLITSEDGQPGHAPAGADRLLDQRLAEVPDQPAAPAGVVHDVLEASRNRSTSASPMISGGSSLITSMWSAGHLGQDAVPLRTARPPPSARTGRAGPPAARSRPPAAGCAFGRPNSRPIISPRPRTSASSSYLSTSSCSASRSRAPGLLGVVRPASRRR